MNNSKLVLDQDCQTIKQKEFSIPTLRDIFNLNKNLINQKCPVNILSLEGIAEEYLNNIKRISADNSRIININNSVDITLLILSCIIIILLGIIIYKT